MEDDQQQARRLGLVAVSGTVWPSKRSDKRLSTHGWKLHKREGDRVYLQHINFPRPFPDGEPPSVFVGLSAIDLLNEGDFRLAVSARNISDSSMDLGFLSHHDGKVWSASASFLAFKVLEPPGHMGSPMVLSGTYGFSRNLAGWTLSSGRGERSHSVKILFPRRFGGQPPTVVACLNAIDATRSEDLRVRATVSDVTTEEFRLTVSTWSSSKITGVGVSWIAVDTEAQGLVKCGGPLRFTEGEPAGGQEYKLDEGEGDREATARVDFAGDGRFARKPGGVVCLSMVDAECEQDVRAKAIETAISQDGFNLTLGTWSDTILWGASASWVAFTEGDFFPPAPQPAAVVAPLQAPAPPAAGGASQSQGEDAVAEPQKKKAKLEDVPAAAAAAPVAPSADENSECRICFAAKINTAIVPCGHLCVCYECSRLLKPPHADKCPICRTKINMVIKTFMT